MRFFAWLGPVLLVVLRWLGRGMLTFGSFLLEVTGQLIRTILQGVGAGLAALLRVTAPWLIAGAVIYGTFVYRPDIFQGLLTLGIALALLVLGVRVMFRGLLPGRKPGKK